VPAADVGLVRARVARTSRGGAEVLARVTASTTGRARLTLAREGRTLDERWVDLVPFATGEIPLVDPAVPAGGAAYVVQLEPGRGTPNDDPANDRLALGLPPQRPAVLVWGDLAVGAWSEPGHAFLVRHMAAYEPGVLDAADCVVLTSLPWSRLREEGARDLLRFVAGGGRLLVLGGPRSWRAGGWSGTPLEDDLLGLRVPRPEGPGLALVLALDTSGSTAHGSLGHLVRAARRVAESLRPGEQLAVLPFAAHPAPTLLPPGWVRAEDPASAHAALEEALDGLVSGGGTDLAAALLAGARFAADTDARARRVLLLTDGDPDQRPDAQALAEVRQTLTALGVDASALVSGMPEVAARLRESLGGAPDAVLLLDAASEIPERILHEIARVRREAELLPRPLHVEWASGETAVDLEPSFLQELEPAAQGRVVARATWGEGGRPPVPFAARRAVGAGETLALAWGPEWEDDPQAAGRRLTPLVEALARSADRGVAADVEGDEVVVRLPGAKGRGRVGVEGAGPSGVLLEVAPGLFRGPVPGGALPGLSVVLPAAPGAAARRVPLRLPALADPEHRGAGVDEDALVALAEAGGGSRLPAGSTPPPGDRPADTPLAPWLLLAAIMLLVVDRAWTEGRALGVRSTLEEGASP